tara:strand:+ start:577 stop:822 length:246 start_codon:yes stop_codon:yes gene_type:complete
MTAGLLYKCKWRTNQWNYDNNSWDRGWDLLLFIGVETINRDDGVVINNYRFHDVINNKSVLMDQGLIKHCEEIKGESHECD